MPLNKFYFHTGVNAYKTPNFPFDYHKKVGNVIGVTGELLIPFECEAPENATLMFLTDYDNLSESRLPNVRVYRVYNTTLVSKYAYFMLNNTDEKS